MRWCHAMGQGSTAPTHPPTAQDFQPHLTTRPHSPQSWDLNPGTLSHNPLNPTPLPERGTEASSLCWVEWGLVPKQKEGGAATTKGNVGFWGLMAPLPGSWKQPTLTPASDSRRDQGRGWA